MLLQFRSELCLVQFFDQRRSQIGPVDGGKTGNKRRKPPALQQTREGGGFLIVQYFSEYLLHTVLAAEGSGLLLRAADLDHPAYFRRIQYTRIEIDEDPVCDRSYFCASLERFDEKVGIHTADRERAVDTYQQGFPDRKPRPPSELRLHRSDGRFLRSE